MGEKELDMSAVYQSIVYEYDVVKNTICVKTCFSLASAEKGLPTFFCVKVGRSFIVVLLLGRRGRSASLNPH